MSISWDKTFFEINKRYARTKIRKFISTLFAACNELIKL